MRSTVLAVLALLFSLAAGCETVDSGDVATDAIYANMTFHATGDGTTEATATLRAGGPLSNTYLELTPNDSLVAYAGPDLSDAMNEQNVLNVVSYHSTFPIDVGETPFKISFIRSHDSSQECNGVSAPNSTATLPPGFAITAPVGNPTYSRATDPITLTWASSGSTDAMSWSAVGACIQVAGSAITGDPGTLTIPAGMIMGSTTSGTCAVTLGLERGRDGVLDPAYGEGGTIRARQTRSVVFNSAP